MRVVSNSKRFLMKVIVFVLVLGCSIGVLPNIISVHNNVVITADAATVGQKNALDSAKSYLEYMSFSKKGLIDQLKFDGYTTKEANYAVKHCGANWTKQALKSAKNYLDTMAFSKKGLTDQLKFDGYTTKEANYGVKNCGANWKKQAVKSAKNYMSIMSFSKKELQNQLEFDGFTKSEAAYGVKNAYK
jgi:hypothetical protein